MRDDPLIDVLQATVTALEEAGIPYAVTGSVASAIHGEPFVSQDVDIVIRMSVRQARQIAQALPHRFYRSAERLEEVAENGGIANLIDADSGLKVDLSILPAGEYFDLVLARRAREMYGPEGPSFYTVSAEDTILMKLLWRKDTRSSKQWDNALSVARVQGASMDWKYLFEQARSLGLEDDLTRLRDESGI
ncbi:MAG: nucleotidyltransferase family protein [Planctomycetes bacterium]|nr:nucleotidyltransferase family protein [Planctomycetota bacterium]